nr:hypothetical protein [uncultured bacterium]
MSSDEISWVLLQQPDAWLILDKVQRQLEEEARMKEVYLATVTEQEKAELINGTIVHHSPVKTRHADASEDLFILLRIYARKHKLGRVGHEKMAIECSRNIYEPDICFWSLEVSSRFEPDQMLFPPPAYIAEVLSPSTTDADRGIKFRDYAAHGVQEYWIIDPEHQVIEAYDTHEGLFLLRGKYQGETPLEVRSLPGLNFPARAVFESTVHDQALHSI